MGTKTLRHHLETTEASASEGSRAASGQDVGIRRLRLDFQGLVDIDTAIAIANTWVIGSLAGVMALMAGSSRFSRTLAATLRALFTSAEKWQAMTIFID